MGPGGGWGGARLGEGGGLTVVGINDILLYAGAIIGAVVGICRSHL